MFVYLQTLTSDKYDKQIFNNRIVYHSSINEKIKVLIALWTPFLMVFIVIHDTV